GAIVMSSRISRRAALKTLSAAGAGVTLAPAVLRGQPSAIVVNGKPVEIAIASVSPSTVRLSVSPVAATPAAVRNDGALVAAANGRGLGRWRANFTPVTSGELVVRLSTDSQTLHIDTLKGVPIQQLVLDPKSSMVSFALGKGPLFGLGEGGPQFDRKGSSYTTRNGQGGYQLRTHGGRVPIQWLVSTDGWGMFIHRPLGAFDLTGSTGTLTPTDDTQPLDVFITASADPTAIMREYGRITGFAEMPPRWAFGYMQSHRTLSGPDEVMWVARTLREKRLPCDALIYLGTEFTPSGWNTRNGEFGWKPENFPNPKQMVDTLHAQDFKVVLHVVIEGRRMSGAVADACTPDNAVPSGRTADDKWPEDRAVACYWPYHKPLYDLGVDGLWPDQGDGLDEPSRLARIRMYWEGPQLYRSNERPFALHRNGSPGMQRYGAFLWSGDVYSFWETLKTHTPVAINTGLSGIPFWGTDIGGFVPTADYTGELHVRWFQFGTFCPSFRAHGRNWHLRLPWGWNTGKLGPAELRGYTGGAADPDPKELNNPHVEPIVKKYLELRYRLLPYTYTVARECVDTGLPMMRALWLHHSDDPHAVARGDQFLWGRDILVSPVVEKGATTRRLYLPKGKWFDFWTEQALDGGREIDRAVDLETMPLHVRSGAIIPLDPVRQHVDEIVEQPLVVTVYPGLDGMFEMYDDDGKTFGYRRGEWVRVAMKWTDATRRLSISLAPGSDTSDPIERLIDVRIAGETARRGVLFEGKPVVVQL
ncbi:MAG: TIM-barrel domain-containing protein, partial [Vicinamibacterales bacterium]